MVVVVAVEASSLVVMISGGNNDDDDNVDKGEDNIDADDTTTNFLLEVSLISLSDVRRCDDDFVVNIP